MESPEILSNEIRDVRQRGGQDFNSLREENRKNGTLFEDPEFPPTEFSGMKDPGEIEWLRPSQICENPEFFVEGASRFDVKQGSLGDCWLAAAFANLTLHDHLFSFVVPSDNTFADEYYAGIFHFRFWQCGHWEDVVIDDRLPVSAEENGPKPKYYMKSSVENEFWSCLLEKAYAKLHGSYTALKGGVTSEAMEDVSGGLALSYKLQEEKPEDLWQIMRKTHAIPSMMGAEILTPGDMREDGLVNEHAYSITKIATVDLETPGSKSEVRLIRLRNPWGSDEWNGSWSDKSKEWESVSDNEKKRLEWKPDTDDGGEFWMSLEDFVENFDCLKICILNPGTIPDWSSLAGKRKGQMIAFEGEWVRGVTAGGCADYQNSYPHNPQYIITLSKPNKDGVCPVTVALMQKNHRIVTKFGAGPLRISFSIYPLAGACTRPVPLNRDFFMNQRAVAGSPEYSNERQVALYFELPPGEYCIIPSTKEPNEQGEFLLRVFEGTNVDMREYDVKMRMVDIPIEAQKQDERAMAFFKKIAGKDMGVDWKELKTALDSAMKRAETIGAAGGFSEDTCQAMIEMMDANKTGKLGLGEFKKLLNLIRAWQEVFHKHDEEKTGYLNPFELREALKSAGYFVNACVLNVLCHRYADERGRVAFDDFITCAVRLKSMLEIIGKEATANSENVKPFDLVYWRKIMLNS